MGMANVLNEEKKQQVLALQTAGLVVAAHPGGLAHPKHGIYS